MEGAYGMMEAGVLCAGIDHGREAELLNTREALHEGVLHDIEQQSFGDLYESEDGVVYYFIASQ